MEIFCNSFALGSLRRGIICVANAQHGENDESITINNARLDKNISPKMFVSLYLSIKPHYACPID
jgi:hypothetical protein